MDKVVLITGASSGMGKALALYYAKQKQKLSIADIDATNLQETAKNCSAANGDNTLHTVTDMAKDEDVKAFVDVTIEKFGRINIVINCAGILRTSNLLDANLMELYDKVMAVNLRSVVFLTSLCAPHLIKSKGCVINIASMAAVMTIPRSLVYSVSKAGVDHFTRCAALELAPHGVRVNAVLPGVVESNLYINSGMSPETADLFNKSVEAMTPLKRIIDTSEIVDLVAFLASDKARSITGSSYLIDAGNVLSGWVTPKS